MKYIYLILLIGFSTFASAQHFGDSRADEKIKSLVSGNKEITGFGNVDFRIGQLLEGQVLMIGGYGGILINKNIMLGVAGYGMATSVGFDGFDPETDQVKRLNLYGGYAGVLMGFKVMSREIVHLSVPFLIGAGQLDVSDDNFFNDVNGDNSYTLESSSYFLFEPSALLEVNISHHFRLGFGAGYRIVKGMSLYNVADDQMSGFTGVISFQVGKF